ncbi:MAG: ATP-binding protein [Candidatus Contendobacter sp.]|nr:ATP-binding protein [Candidatus Contendobacter sp.]
MRTFAMRLARPTLTLRQLLGGTYLAATLLLAIGVVYVLGRHLDDHFRRELLDRGRILVERLTEDSRLALIQSESDSLRPRLETALIDPNVAGIVVATARGTALVSSGKNPVLSSLSLSIDAMEDAPHVIETAETLMLVAPVRSSAITTDFFARRAPQSTTASVDPLGFVALTLTKAKSQTDLHAINRYIFVVMVAGAALLTLLALVILRHSTRPLKRLAHTMSDPGTVEHFRRVEVNGVREAQLIATAFNEMMARIANSQADLARQVEEAVREVKQQNEELTQAREQAEAASRVKSEFMANMSHEIRTPLHGFMGFIDLLTKTRLDHTQQGYLHLLKHSASSLLVVINGILDFSKLEAGKMPLRIRPFQLEEMIKTTVRLFDPNASAKGLILEIEIDPDLPETVSGDRQRLAQVVHNLVDNAIKFTERGRVRVRVGGLFQHDGAFLCHLIVQDTGIGIPRAHQCSIFAAFNQVDASTTRQQGGTGLGLAICKQLLDLMRGRIEVSSQEGAGSEFRVEVPLSIARAMEPTDEPPSERTAFEEHFEHVPAPLSLPIELFDSISQSTPPRSEPPRLLVVDDNLTNRTFAKVTFSHLGVEVVMAENGLDALEACRRQRFDMILMDIRMPELDGLETTRRIRREHANPNCRVPIIGLTADLLNVDRQSWKEAGMNDCLFKPLSEDRLSQTFAAWGIDQRSTALPTPNFRRMTS